MSSARHITAAFAVPPALTKPYTGEQYVSRAPFLMNDLVDDRSKRSLRDEKIKPDRVFMGIAGFRALDLLSISGRDNEPDERYRQALLFDNNEQQVKAMNNILKLIDESETPQEFKKAFRTHYTKWVDHVPARSFAKTEMSDERRSRLNNEKEYFAVHGRSTIPQTNGEISAYFTEAGKDDNSWLQPENYYVIRQLVKKGRIATATLDLRDEERFSALQADWQEKGLKLGHVYISSLLNMLAAYHSCDYHGNERAGSEAKRADIMKLHANLSPMLDDESLCICSLPITRDSGESAAEGAGKDGSGEKKFELAGFRRAIFSELCNDFANSEGAVLGNEGTFAVGQKTYQMHWSKAKDNWEYDYYKKFLNTLQPDDVLLEAHVSSKPRAFRRVDQEPLTRLISDMANWYKLDWLGVPAEEEGRLAVVAIRVPREVYQDDTDIPDMIMKEIKKCIQQRAHMVEAAASRS